MQLIFKGEGLRPKKGVGVADHKMTILFKMFNPRGITNPITTTPSRSATAILFNKIVYQ